MQIARIRIMALSRWDAGDDDDGDGEIAEFTSRLFRRLQTTRLPRAPVVREENQHRVSHSDKRTICEFPARNEAVLPRVNMRWQNDSMGYRRIS